VVLAGVEQVIPRGPERLVRRHARTLAQPRPARNAPIPSQRRYTFRTP
jgi:hypothetical protein